MSERHKHPSGAWPDNPQTHILYHHPEVERLDPDWQQQPKVAHEAIHRMWESPEQQPTLTPPLLPQVGDTLYGFCHGYFGRDSYCEKTVLHVGRDYIVVREHDQFGAVAVANTDPLNLGDCLTNPEPEEA